MSEIERLRAWKREAMPLFDGLQDLGRALGLPLGVLVTGPLAVKAANNLLDRLEAAEAAVARVRAIHRPSTDHGPRYAPYCVGCWEAGGEDGAPLWPCPTIAALDDDPCSE